MNKIEKAIKFATKAHAGQFRKGTDRPYILHPIETMIIAKRFSYDDEDLISAALLHDVVEDTSVTLNRVEKEFGHCVASLVDSVSEDKMRKLPAEATWRARKWNSIFKLRKAGHDTKILVLADNLSNLRELYQDYEEIGDEIWERFNQKDPALHVWYYEEILGILAEDCCLEDAEELLDFGDLVWKLKYLVEKNNRYKQGWWQ